MIVNSLRLGIMVARLVRHPEHSEGSPELATVLNFEILRAKKRAQDHAPGHV